MTTIVASNNIKYSSDGISSTVAPAIVKTLTMTDNYIGNWRIVFDLRGNTPSRYGYGTIYKNGVSYGTQRSQLGYIWGTFSEDFSGISISSGDTISLRVYVSSGTSVASVQNFRAEFDKVVSSTFFVMF